MDESHISAAAFPIRELPHDLFDVTLSCCDGKTLLASSTVCQSWLPVARTHLFKRRTVCVSPKCASEFASLSIIPYIRKLSLTLEDDGESDLPPDDTHWLSDLVLPSLGAHCVAVTSLIILFEQHYPSEGFAFPSSMGLIQRCFDQTRDLRLHYNTFLSPMQVAQCASSFPYLHALSISLDHGYRHAEAIDASAMSRLKLAGGLSSLSMEFPMTGPLAMIHQALLEWVSRQLLPLKSHHIEEVKQEPALATMWKLVAKSTSLRLLTLDPVQVNDSSGIDLSSLAALSELRLGLYSPMPIAPSTLPEFVCSSLRSINKDAAPLILIYVPSYNLHPYGEAWDALDDEIATGNFRKVVFVVDEGDVGALHDALRKSLEAKKAFLKYGIADSAHSVILV